MSAKLDDPKTAPKTYWSIMHKLFHNKKIPIIPSVLVNGELIFDFQKKADLFINHITSQCTPIKSTGKLPNFNYKTVKRLTSFLDEDYILLIIKNLKLIRLMGGMTHQ